MTAFIIEGVDGTGKSTLAARLSSIYGLPVHKIGGAPKDSEDMDRHLDEQARLVKNGHIILDRTTAISQRVYDSVLGSGEYSGMLDVHVRALKHSRPIFILCETEQIDHVVKDYDDPARIERIMTRLDLLKKTYRDVLAQARIDYLEYDFRKGPSAIIEYLEKRLCN